MTSGIHYRRCERNFLRERKENGESEFCDDIRYVLENRWNKNNIPLHCVAHYLVSKYYSEAWLQSGSDVVPRIAPDEDHEVSLNRAKCFKKMFPNSDDLRRFAEYRMFSGSSGFFSGSHVIESS